MNSVNLKASVSFVGDGSTNRFYFGFDYINKQFVKVQVGADNSPLTYLTDYTVDDRSVTLTDTPDVGVAIRIYRETPSDRIVDWADGAFIKASQMTLENLQQLHLIEEAQDYPILNSLSTYPDGVNFNALGSRVINVSDPIDPQDVVTKHYMENVQGGFVAANTILAQEVTKQASAAKSSQEAAKTSETNAKTSETNSEIYHQLAKKWAEATDSPDGEVDTQSRTGKTQSSRSWSLQAEEAIRNINFYMMNILQRSKAYAVGDIAYSPSLPSWARLECVKAGTTATNVPHALGTTQIAGQYITDGTAIFILDDVRDGNRVGDIVLKPTLNDGYIKANGATVKASEYPRLLKFVQDNNLCVSDAEWLNNSSTKYVYNQSADTLKITNVMGRVLQGAEMLDTREAGLPNIMGEFHRFYTYHDQANAEGVFNLDSYKSSSGPNGNGTSNNKACGISFDASRCSSVYGNSNTVQPPACCLIAQIKY